MLSLDPRRTALVLIDLQNWIVNRPLAPHSGANVIDLSVRMARALRKAGGTVVLVRMAFSDGYGDVVKVPVDSPMILPDQKMPSEAVAFDSRISPAIADVVITKRHWSAFHGTELDLQLRRRAVDTVVVAGVATNLAVEGTIRDAFAYNYAPVLAEDAVSSMSAAMHRFSIDNIMPRLARIRPSAEILEAIRSE